MALLNDRIGECWSARAFFHGGGPSSQSLDHLSPIELFGYEEAGSVESLGRHYSSSLLPFVSDPSNSSRSSRQAFGVANSSSQDSLSVVDFKGASGGWCYSNSSLLRFTSSLNLDREDDCDVWIDAMDDQNYQLSCFDMKPGTAEAWLMEDQSFSEMEGDMPSPKKRCASSRMMKDKQSPSKDPHSVAAKNRRERISERLKILQDLVPNGTKVDLVTMLEKAINYVKFLQLQVKVLATDESWPAQGGEST